MKSNPLGFALVLEDDLDLFETSELGHDIKMIEIRTVGLQLGSWIIQGWNLQHHHPDPGTRKNNKQIHVIY
jgi:hypothetical protein